MVATAGLLVASENLTVMVSPFENTASALSGSSALREVIAGPALSPKLPVNAGDVAVDGKDVADSFFRLPASSTVSVNTPICGFAVPISITVISNTDGLVHEPT